MNKDMQLLEHQVSDMQQELDAVKKRSEDLSRENEALTQKLIGQIQAS